MDKIGKRARPTWQCLGAKGSLWNRDHQWMSQRSVCVYANHKSIWWEGVLFVHWMKVTYVGHTCGGESAAPLLRRSRIHCMQRTAKCCQVRWNVGWRWEAKLKQHSCTPGCLLMEAASEVRTLDKKPIRAYTLITCHSSDGAGHSMKTSPRGNWVLEWFREQTGR